MRYKKMDVELIVHTEDAEAVASQLNAALDRLEESYAIFGGGIEMTAVEHHGKQRRSALRHTLAAGETAAVALRTAGEKVADAFRRVV